MRFDFTPKSVLLLIFFFHGIVFSSLLLRKGIRNQNKASLWLSLFVFLCALYIAPFMLGYAGWYSDRFYRDIMFFVPFQQLFLLGPVIFFYTQSQLNKSFALTKKDFLHFVPALGYLAYSLLVFVTDKLILGEYYFYADGRDKDLAPWYQMLGLISMAGYLVLSLRVYSIYKKISYDVVSFAEAISFTWIKRFLSAFLLILVLRVLFFIVNPEWGEFGRKFWYYLCFSGLFYYIAVSGYANSISTIIAFRPAFFGEEASSLSPNLHLSDDASDVPINSDEKQVSEKESVEIPDLEAWKEKVEHLMSVGKAYENPELTLSQVAQALGLHTKKLSQIINQGFNLNFNDFVNYYRTKAVIEKLESGEHNLHNLLGIALDCGFNSKSTFNRAFKKHTELTPKEFLKKYQLK